MALNAHDIVVLLDEEKTSINTLYTLFGNSFIGFEGFGSNALAKGKEAFDNSRRLILKTLCPLLKQPHVLALLQSRHTGDTVSLVGLLANALNALGPEVNWTLAAVLALRLGLPQLCAGQESD